MPKRNLVILGLAVLAALVAWAARRSGEHARLYGEVTGHLRRSYLEPVEDEALFDAAMQGMFERLDGQTGLVPASAASGAADDAGASEAVAGVGLELALDPTGTPLVTTPVAGSPAWRAGIAAGDRIVAIDGAATAGMRLRDAVAALRGVAGTDVVLDVAPPAGDTPETRDERGALLASRRVELRRESLRTETVAGDRRRADGSWEFSLEGEEGVALVRVSGFSPSTADDLDRACAEIAAAGEPRGLILDLRGNRGGLLAAAVDVCDRFLDEGVIVSTRRRDAEPDRFEVRRALPGEVFAAVPMVVLVDGLTASSAEIVAACLQDNGRATVVGSRTFGKGTVQSILPLSDGRSALRMTTAEYLRPSLANIHRHPHHDDADVWGVSPDPGHEISPTAGVLETVHEWRWRRDAIPRHAAAAHVTATADASAAALPRQIDPVIGRALAALGAGPRGQP